ncbi:NACHT domain-containing protein [Streptomyces sp. S465]|uniref:NACHT domain-containing protein n=1 Tax=Streptomyces sp. S465 TaxID=2979468 RepID=UPI0022A8BC18|nr:NACHT domain-containing protein [Streptomyces sp. S465]WAP60489.1 ATP-binding protein [Streptomyces sp. S465]
MPKVIRHLPGKRPPRSAPMATLDLRRAGERFRRVSLSSWHIVAMRLEARRATTRPKKWRRWISYANVTRIVWLVAALAVLAWCGEGLYILVTHETTPFEGWLRGNAGFDAVVRFVGPVLTASIAAVAFLFWWYRGAKRRYLAKARKHPRELVLTAGPDIAEIVGREEVAQVIAQRLRERNTRRPYVLVGGIGAGKTAVLVRLTELLARQHAVPVPIRLRDVASAADMNFERMARKRFAEEAPQSILARAKNERVWQQMLADDKPVVIADGLEEALLDESLQEDRDNIIRRAIERAHAEKLPLVIASRPHSPLESTQAAIMELEPLSEEEALHFLEARVPETDERRVDWIVETAEVTESPIYLQIARELHRHGALERDRPRNDPQRLDTRSWDRSTLRLWLLETWDHALCEGRLREDVALAPQERRDTLEVLSALACIGLLQDKVEVGFAELLDQDVHPGPARRARARAEHLWARRRGFDRYGKRGNALSERHREHLWDALCDRLSAEESRRLREGNMGQCQAALARFANNANKLELVEGCEQKVRFPHTIIQAYLGFRMLSHLGERGAGELIEQVLQPPGPSRELLIALVLLSRQQAAKLTAECGSVRAEMKKQMANRWRQASVSGRSLAHRLHAAANHRTDDPKVLDLYAAALEVESVEENPKLLSCIVGTVHARWDSIKGDRRTVEDAKRRLLKQLGAALRKASDKIDTTPLYEMLFEIGIAEPTYPIRLAAAQEFGSGGNAAFAVIRERVGLNSDPVREYNERISDLKAWKRQEHQAWADEIRRARAARAFSPTTPGKNIEQLQRNRQDFKRRYQKQRADLIREFAMRAWMLPMLLGSVDDAHRDEARERLTKWLRHLDPKFTGGAPDLPLALEAALAQGFKYAANRRKRHPHTYPGSRADLIRQAETVLQQSRCWYAQISLLQALCLWELPDDIGRHEQDEDTWTWPDGDGHAAREPSRGIGGTTAVQTVKRWLSMAGTVNGAPGQPGMSPDSTRPCVHPFVAEAGDLVALALETGQVERFLWIDEKGVADNIGSRTRTPTHGAYRKHNLWIPPSAGWSTLDGRAQRLVADLLVMLNLIERDGHPDEVEERLARAEQPDMPLPPCIRADRDALRPGLRAGVSTPPVPGTTCLADCTFQLCPYPPLGSVSRGEIREPFCRQQQALLPGRWRRCLPRGLRRKTPYWVGMRVRELDRFWDAMARRTRHS